jgi:Zn-dependent protease with chaperone function
LATVALSRVWAQYWPTHYLSFKGSSRISESNLLIYTCLSKDKEDNRKISFDLNKIKREVAIEAGLSPKNISIHLSKNTSCNIITMGSSSAGAIQVTEETLEQLILQSDYDQALAESRLKAILIPEMGHLKHNDSLFLKGILTINELSSIFIGHILGFGLIKKFIINVVMTQFISMFFRSRVHYADEMTLEYSPEHQAKLLDGLNVIETGHNNLLKEVFEPLGIFEKILSPGVLWLFRRIDRAAVTHPEIQARREHLDTLKEFNMQLAPRKAVT